MGTMLTVTLSSLPSPPASAGSAHLTRLSHAIVGRLVDVQVHPDTTKLPGGEVLQNLMNGLDGWALAL